VIVGLTVPAAIAFALAARPVPAEPTALFRGLNRLESAIVRARLDRWGGPYDIRDGGQTVMVPADRRAEVIVEFAKMASENPGVTWAVLHQPDNAELDRATHTDVTPRKDDTSSVIASTSR
jgi:hypothetical protein